MEKFAFTLQSQSDVEAYIADCSTRYERELLVEIIALIKAGDQEQLTWFGGFGDSLRQILMNVNEYRHALGFGFAEIAFNRYGWFASPKFLDFEEISLGQSYIRIGRGPNGSWAYALSRQYGTAGASGPLCVFCKKYPDRDTALAHALAEIKADMTKYLGHPDTTNYKQDVLHQTLKAIAAMEVSRAQLSLF
ncbi:hypothetical protein [Mucilaginibacter rubeus]|uniref:Uncharacterized protein n=1 Tax=Mucilaginibacter rubeus TaxID=2027860 RepID=A0A5C1HVU5_9SPHI|nr:hypothetical protein [Mucilaginibacter rubeus]QEM09992.1 hypothetical protein DEO27_008140 [Mucilaginibacter rubeus]